ncbi:SUMF1/EgtB/PvdO family nonheme iron enzyme, partial [bacterium]|nr:SUMF1/EgtB/PvdO family nonheme iron enzyme [bacterium]
MSPGIVRDDGMVRVPAGSFVMGSRLAADQMPVRRIRLPEFWIDRTEVTAGAYEAYRQSRNLPAPGPPLWADGELIAEYAEHPAYPVTWTQADKYCRAMGKRLPTEAEW